MDPSDRPSAEEPLNPYRAPASPVHDEYGEADIRRDGRFLVIGLHGALHSVCAHCGSTRDLAPRRVSVVWRNPVGCLTTLVLGMVVLVTIMSANHIPADADFVGWLLGAAALGVLVVNVVWRSRRVALNYSLCVDCRARRGRWLIGWAVVFAGVIVVAFVFAPILALVLLPLYVVADRLQPAALRPAKVVRDEIWLRGVGESVLERFPDRASPED